MKRRSFPLWLLRDVPALLGVLISFWPLVIAMITSARRATLGKKVRKSFFEDFSILVAHAEARLVFALWRQAYRRLGWNPRSVPFTLIPACDDWSDSLERFRNYANALVDMNGIVDAYVDDLRERFNISQREAANASRCPLRLATRATSPMLRMREENTALFSSLAVRRGRWIATSASRDGGGSHSSRGPP